MIPALKAELRKLVTVRSTYVVLGVCFILEILFAFYGSGIKVAAADLHNPHYLASQVTGAVMVLSTLIALIGILLVTHEYRYNTIMYTLTSSRSRAQVLLSKLLVMSVFAILFSVIFGALSPLMTLLGVHIKGHVLMHQVIPVGDLLWRSALTGWGFAMLALILAFIIRIQVGAIVALFLIPGTIEQLLGLLLKHKQAYLPFMALHNVADDNPMIPHGRAAAVSCIYIVIGWIIALILFQRRDAN